MHRLKRRSAGLDAEEMPVCDSCGYPVPESDLHEVKGLFGVKDKYCTLCDNSRNMDLMERQHQNFCTNAILDQLGAFAPPKSRVVPL